MQWPDTAEALVQAQELLARATPDRWVIPEEPVLVGGCFACFAPDERGWAGAAVLRRDRVIGRSVAEGRTRDPYTPGLLALREGPLLAEAVTALPERPDVLLVNATGLDHPRRAGLALHLGAALDLPTVGVTDRPLLAGGGQPGPQRGATAPLVLDGEVVGHWVRTRAGVRPVAVHGGWRTDPATAVTVVLRTARRARTPEPLRRAREAARRARTGAG